MNTDATQDHQRTKQACNPCRRKKAKCPGQKPSCSTCQRLGQICSYGRGRDDYRVSKDVSRRSGRAGSEDRMKRIESRLEELYDAIETIGVQLPQNNQTSSSTSSVPATGSVAIMPVSASLHRLSRGRRFDEVECPEPGEEVMDMLISIYRDLIDHRPLPLFDANDVSVAKASEWPLHLRRSFLSTTVAYCEHPFYAGLQERAVQFYINSARKDATHMMWDASGALPICQSFCLLALTDISFSNTISARMNINIGIAQAKSVGYFSISPSSVAPEVAELRSRCCWSLLTLDLVYNSSSILARHVTDDGLLGYPQSVETPPAADPAESQLDEPPSPVEDLGITAYCLQLIVIWGDVMDFVNRVKQGKSTEAWFITSQYHEINVKLYQFETKLAQAHRFQKTSFTRRTPTELKCQSKYWDQWLLMQFILHALQALLNHPFIHIAGQRTKFQPPSFLQNTVDQAILHVCWISKLMDACSQQQFDLHNPFLGHLVSIAATIFLFLIRSKNNDLALQATNGYHRCIDFILKLGKRWKHLQHTIEKLQLLFQVAKTSETIPSYISASSVQSSLLWELLDYAASTAPSTVQETASDVVDLNVNTTFLSPVSPVELNRTHPRQSTSHGQAPEASLPLLDEDGGWEQAPSDIGWNLFATEQMAGFTQFSPDRNMWNFGQL